MQALKDDPLSSSPPRCRRWKWFARLLILGGVGLVYLDLEYPYCFPKNNLENRVVCLLSGILLTASGLILRSTFKRVQQPVLSRWRERPVRSYWIFLWIYVVVLLLTVSFCWYQRYDRDLIALVTAAPPRILGNALWLGSGLPRLDDFSEVILFATAYYAILLSPILGLIRLRRLTLGFLAWLNFLTIFHIIMMLQAFILAANGLTEYPSAPM